MSILRIENCFKSEFQIVIIFELKLILEIDVNVSRGSSVSIVSGYGLDDWAIEVQSPAEANGSFL
jgi:hypothetical protein